MADSDSESTEESVGQASPQASPPRPGQRRVRRRPRRRARPGYRALQEIRKYQRTTDHLVPRAPFSRLVREVLDRMGEVHYRWQEKAIEAIQESAEMYLVALFEDAQVCAFHGGRITAMVRDIQLTRRIYARHGH